MLKYTVLRLKKQKNACYQEIIKKNYGIKVKFMNNFILKRKFEDWVILQSLMARLKDLNWICASSWWKSIGRSILEQNAREEIKQTTKYYEPDNIFNADEIVLCFRMIHSKILTIKNISVITLKKFSVLIISNCTWSYRSKLW